MALLSSSDSSAMTSSFFTSKRESDAALLGDVSNALIAPSVSCEREGRLTDWRRQADEGGLEAAKRPDPQRESLRPIKKNIEPRPKLHRQLDQFPARR